MKNGQLTAQAISPNNFRKTPLNCSNYSLCPKGDLNPHALYGH